MRRCATNTVQLVDAVPISTYARLRREVPSLRIVQVLHVADEAVLEEAREVGPHVDALLLDSGNPKLAVKELGGTGRVHDWALSRRVVEEAPCPVFLAGGLRAENVREAIARVRPFGVDVCSGVRSTGQLDVQKLSAFTRSVANADVVPLP